MNLNKKQKASILMLLGVILLVAPSIIALEIYSPTLINDCDSLTNLALAYDGSYATLSIDNTVFTQGTGSAKCVLFGTGLFRLHIYGVSGLATNPIIAFDVFPSSVSVTNPLVQIVTHNGTSYLFSYYTFVFTIVGWQTIQFDLRTPSSGDVPFLRDDSSTLLIAMEGVEGKTFYIDNIIKGTSTAPPPPPTLTATVSPSTANITVGQSQSFIANPAGGGGGTPPYTYNWFIGGSSVGVTTQTYSTSTSLAVGTYQITVQVTDSLLTSATSVAAILTVNALPPNPPPETPTQVTIVIATTQGGTTSPISGNYTYAKGLTVIITATANADYTFAYWLFSDGSNSTSNPIVLTTDNSYSLEAHFIISVQTPPTTTPTTTPPATSSSTPISRSNIVRLAGLGLVAVGFVVWRRKKET